MTEAALSLNVDDELTDLRFKVGAAIEFDRPLDLTIDGASAQLAVRSVRRLRGEASRLVVGFETPNDFRLQQLDIPDTDEGRATALMYPQE